ncbi:hypothetical protein CC1G_14980 [Coprinopsis cinerea okayama7|uniref:Uncharacterized protein n=1 Tax=Coprinopsis cinerea (strain Okayama-7 / 130 / ATCC MYA-4618 / FGSC 9003) TaxID=240176 RepID=D6RPB9_COPC7|nr:hypothetical protein CC1G_14980 [Coprinopsis cinerea okayama7\|eukprot:XP_002910649.1 hypothetical protein CC1G_14980 [Coprinopsis cinerea okayama7\
MTIGYFRIVHQSSCRYFTRPAPNENLEQVEEQKWFNAASFTGRREGTRGSMENKTLRSRPHPTLLPAPQFLVDGRPPLGDRSHHRAAKLRIWVDISDQYSLSFVHPVVKVDGSKSIKRIGKEHDLGGKKRTNVQSIEEDQLHIVIT